MKKQILKGVLAMVLGIITIGNLNAQKESTSDVEKKEAIEQARVEAMAEREKVLLKKEKHLQEILENSQYVTGEDFEIDVDLQFLPRGDVFVVRGDQSSSSQLSLSKSFEGESKESDGSFDVDKSSRSISITITGAAKSGSIDIRLVRPDGEEQGNLKVDASADVRFTKRIRFAEESKEYIGEWKYYVTAKDAKGYYKLSISTN